MKCSVCNLEAAYEYKLTQTSSLFYCEKDLPKFLFARKKAGSLSIAPVSAPEVPAPTVVEEPSSTEAPAAEPKKAVKKTAK